MTKLLNRFRQQLVKMLGGYPAEDYVARRSIVHLRRVFVEDTVPAQILMYACEATKRELAYKIGYELLKGNLINFMFEEAPLVDSKVIRAEVRVIEQESEMKIQI